jgi:hypothetical protein
MPFSQGAELDVVTLDLPAGNFVINAKVWIGNRSNHDGDDFMCTLRHGLTGNMWIDGAGIRLFGDVWQAGGSAMLPLTGTVTLASPETIRLHCGTTSSDAIANYGQLNATAVDSIT